ncbi:MULTISPECIES: hypothetical protein [unclassified Saccharicrinis]|uniref:hypothetical protein n=1 Tax=unclassified Saccharicrinis TaxID=2646859 RepID=UPI003D326ADA
MKNILNISLVVALFALWSCEDVTDDFDGLDDPIVSNHVGKAILDAPYTLTEEDYALSSNEDVLSFKNFSNYLPAKDYLPEILDAKFYTDEIGTEFKITYLFYKGSLSYLYDLEDVTFYELTTSDYDSFGGDAAQYNNFSSSARPENYLPDFFANKYSSAEAGDIVYVTYDYYSGGVSVISEFYEFDGSIWASSDESVDLPEGVEIYVLTSEDYDSMGAPGNYNNFSASDVPENYLPTFLSIKFPYAFNGIKIATVFKYYAGGGVTETRAIEYLKTETGWTAYSSTENKTETFKYDGDVWLYVPPIKFIKTDKAHTIEYTLNDDDYEFVGNGRYDNFDVREGQDEETEEVRIEKITKILKNNFEVALGEVYKVTFEVYSGSAETWDITLEAVEDN